MEALALEHPSAHSLPTQFFRFQSDERLIGHIRKGQPKAFETLVKRYQGRLLSFCSQIVNSQEDAEDIVQDVFASAFSAIFADSRPIHVRPWLYRIARNRCLNHLRRPMPAGQESMDVFEQPGGATTVDHVHTREEFRHLVADVRQLPDSQRRALLLREVNSLSYEEIADEMDTSVSSVKSLLARARTSLGEAADSRLLSCDDARAELEGEAESAGRLSATTRRHLKRCEYCRRYRAQLRKPGLKAAALLFPLPVIGSVKKLVSAKLTAATGGAPPAAGAAGAGLTGAGLSGAGISGAGLSGAGVSGAAATGGAITGGAGVVATKAAVSIVAAGLVTAGAYEARQVAPEQTLAENLAFTHPGSVSQKVEKPGPRAADGADRARLASPDAQQSSPPPGWAATSPGQDRPASSPTVATAGGQTTTSQPGAKPRHHLTAAEQGANIASIGSRATSQSVYGSPSTWSGNQSDQYQYGQNNGPVGVDGLLSSSQDTQAQGTGSSSGQGVQDVPFAIIGSSASSLSSSSQGQSQQSGQSPPSQQQTSSGAQSSYQSQGSAQKSTSSNSQTSSEQGSRSSSSSSQSSSDQGAQSAQNSQSGSQQQQSTRQSQSSQSQNYQGQSSQSGG